jgi:hypothetical protein
MTSPNTTQKYLQKFLFLSKLQFFTQLAQQVSPLITQLTYEGLIDEFFNIRHSSVRLPAEKFLAPSAGMDDQVSTFENIFLRH